MAAFEVVVTLLVHVVCSANFGEEMTTEEPLYVYAAFGKTGSSTLQQVFENNLGEAYIDLHSRNDLTKGRVFYGNGMYAQFDAPVLVPPRPIKYFTLIRNPIDRLESAYNYFCLRCEERFRQCRGRENPTILTCPDLALHDYARAFGNLYTRAFSHPRTYVDLNYNVTAADYDAAVTWLNDNRPYVMFTETLTDNFDRLAQYIGHPLHVPRKDVRNSNDHEMIIPDWARLEIATNHFAWDVKLYDYLFFEYTQPVF